MKLKILNSSMNLISIQPMTHVLFLKTETYSFSLTGDDAS